MPVQSGKNNEGETEQGVDHRLYPSYKECVLDLNGTKEHCRSFFLSFFSLVKEILLCAIDESPGIPHGLQ